MAMQHPQLHETSGLQWAAFDRAMFLDPQDFKLETLALSYPFAYSHFYVINDRWNRHKLVCGPTIVDELSR